MARPVKWRQIQSMPEIMNFSPTNILDETQKRNVLKMEELEAIRLKDLEGLDQNECAELMEVSRPTFRRILLSARIKIADSLVHGKALSFDGGNYVCNPERSGGRGRGLGQGRGPGQGHQNRGNGLGRGQGMSRRQGANQEIPKGMDSKESGNEGNGSRTFQDLEKDNND